MKNKLELANDKYISESLGNMGRINEVVFKLKYVYDIKNAKDIVNYLNQEYEENDKFYFKKWQIKDTNNINALLLSCEDNMGNKYYLTMERGE